jgi:hypothetical protein
MKPKPDIRVRWGWHRDKETGHRYQVFGLARYSVTGDWLVVYVHESCDFLVAVPAEDWQERMEFEEEQDGR